MKIPAMDTVLEKIAAKVRHRIEDQKLQVPLRDLVSRLGTTPARRNFAEAFFPGRLNVIAEIKFASPSEGTIREGGDPGTIAQGYLEQGAAAVSVLTEPDFFGGNLRYLEEVRVRVPGAFILMKDFFMDAYQVAQAKLAGANAVLLMVSLLGPDRFRELFTVCADFAMTPLVEIHDESELGIALEQGSKLVGVNNRDLRTLKTSLDVSRNLIEKIPDSVVAISESGFRTRDQLEEFRALGFDGFLIGTSLMRAPDPGLALSRLLKDR